MLQYLYVVYGSVPYNICHDEDVQVQITQHLVLMTTCIKHDRLNVFAQFGKSSFLVYTQMACTACVFLKPEINHNMFSQFHDSDTSIIIQYGSTVYRDHGSYRFLALHHHTKTSLIFTCDIQAVQVIYCLDYLPRFDDRAFRIFSNG